MVMPKSSKKQLYLDEKKVIKQLKQNSKESIDTIAKKCGFSRQKVWRIIKRLENTKTIWGYYPVTDDEKLKVKRFVMLIKRSSEPLKDAVQKIVDLTMHKKGEKLDIEIIYSSYLHGLFDWIFIFTAPDIKQTKRFRELLLKEYGEIISDVLILEDIFSVKRCGITNPQVEKLKEFF
jgi:DNA-binding Lrp family transcriptional regulator